MQPELQHDLQQDTGENVSDVSDQTIRNRHHEGRPTARRPLVRAQRPLKSDFTNFCKCHYHLLSEQKQLEGVRCDGTTALQSGSTNSSSSQ